LKIKKGRQKGTLMLLLCLLVLLFSVPVKGHSPVFRESEPKLKCGVYGPTFNSQPYIAAYMAADYIENGPKRGPNANAVRVTVSFSGTDSSVIQSDNWLAAGIAAQGPDHVHGGCNAIDWGYVLALILEPSVYPKPYIHAEVFKGHEWVNCLPGYVECVKSWDVFLYDLTISSYVTLTMMWGEDTLDYYAKVGGNTIHLYSYTPEETASHYFKTGTSERQYWIIPFSNTVKWLQFPGAWSNYCIGEEGWHSRLSNHGFIEVGSSSWTDVPFAYSTDGYYSYWDHLFIWGGYPHFKADATYSYEYVHFYQGTAELEPDTLLWEPSDRGGGCPMLSVYDGTDYVEEGLLDIHNPEGVDMVYEHTLVTTPERADGAHLMRLTEHPKTHSFIDQVKLYAMLEDGTMKELPLTWAWHSEDGNVLPQLLHSDEWKADTSGADHNEGTSQSIDLKFAALSPNLEVTGFMFQIEGNNRWEK
jgi:hypothetical protein